MSEIARALEAAGVAVNREAPDGEVSVVRGDGSRFAVGYDGVDDDGVQWWTGTWYSPDGDQGDTDSWTSAAAAASYIADWAKR